LEVVLLVLVEVDTDLLLLLGMGWMGARHIGPLRALTRENVERGAQLLSSYNNNSNNPLCGTDQLRDAW
jgi:hypothetical protein